MPPASNQLGPHRGKPVRPPPTNSSLQRLQSRDSIHPASPTPNTALFPSWPGCYSLCARNPSPRCEARQTPAALSPTPTVHRLVHRAIKKEGEKRKKKKKRSKRPMQSVLPPRTSPFLCLAWPGTETTNTSCHPQGRNPPPPPRLG